MDAQFLFYILRGYCISVLLCPFFMFFCFVRYKIKPFLKNKDLCKYYDHVFFSVQNV